MEVKLNASNKVRAQITGVNAVKISIPQKVALELLQPHNNNNTNNKPDPQLPTDRDRVSSSLSLVSPIMADTNDEESGTKSSVATTEIPPVATAQDDSLQPLESAEPPKELTLPVVFKKRRKLAHHYQRRPVDNENDAKEGASDDNSQALVKETPTVVRRPPRPQPKHGFIVSTRAPDYSMIATADELNAQPAPDPLAGRFVKSSGQVLDKDDKLL